IFFTVGATAIMVSALSEEIALYFEQRQIPAQVEAYNERLRQLSAKYELQIAQLKADPSLKEKLRTYTFNEKPEEEDTVFPEASATDLAEAKAALMSELDSRPESQPIPKWVLRCSEPQIRKTLLVAGIGLVLITFIFFGTPCRRTVAVEIED
ncbi:MAG: hypothetical protein JXA82_17290, partial [Sedimentisphaerales bacterium]|nr:hypothetical protein [Sedimentisphaerales bacterium]